ncbi:16S rRNA (guanine(966)-N(2))-methyltransferase RsmD [Methylovirgula sp. 4M-Z18]|uniref:16S rRNA (guanine(966)-N(2))-methyltransferase RsmD n=1 Tax=Methylovirgula sp. 4M-Z18 TaxID=2293567 RepID=UPI000E2EB081|nr:16S rRNA (guanine(966)-N(2))-methyltransferase RsmD [Methylovirgula sp. 4M-Z18]RFB75065.1 16S rRNA (guanine(966)-N(2))-methyltransferase RsmD [Methylovirgula sp. 4M-Z18]
MRIVGGAFKGRVLKGPSGPGLRPTSDRLRETIFNILAHSYDDCVRDARVIDLFAGTGALGIEALSRGASFALFVDDGAEARSLIRGHVEMLGLGGVSRIFRRDATKLGEAPPGERFDLAFLDPPYGKGLGERALIALRDGEWLHDEALAIIEEAKGEMAELPGGYAELERRDYGDSQLILVRHLPTR